MKASIPDSLPSAARSDRFMLRHFYIWLAFGAFVYFSDELDRLLNLSFFLIPVLLLPAAIMVITWLICFGQNLWTRRWRALTTVVCAPVLAFALFGTLLKLRIDPDWIHFQITQTFYLREVHGSPGQSLKHRVWNWGDTGSAIGPNIFHMLIYDEGDEPLRGETPLEERDESTDVRPMGDHFFLVTQYR